MLDQTLAAGEAALADTTNEGTALGRYLHAAIDTGLGVVNIIHPLLDDTAWPDRTAAAADMTDRLITDAQRCKAIGPDITAADIAYAAIRFSRPLAVGLDTATEREIAHGQLDHFLDGLAS